MDKVTHQSIILTKNIQVFNNDFANFSRDCSFLSDAFTELINAETHKEDSATVGLIIFSQWVKSRTSELNKNMSEVKTKSNNILRQHTDQG